ncbi:MAG TPA: sporulation inhibitor of replication protein SirA [Ureibacillus sp.]|nr:sporulation inhibitor of replication protein SirA [Ureibacillus sp.]
MRIYSIFNIRKEYQSFIFGRERMLLEMVGTRDKVQESSVSMELSFICEPIEESNVRGQIFRHLQDRFPNTSVMEDTLTIEHQIKGEIKIIMRKYYIEAVCQGSRMLDLDLFQTLGQINDSFLAFNKEEAECGWLKPIKHLAY